MEAWTRMVESLRHASARSKDRKGRPMTDAETPYEKVLEDQKDYLTQLLTQAEAREARADADLVELRATKLRAKERVAELRTALAAIELDLEREAVNSL